MDDPDDRLDGDELWAAKRLLETQAAARGMPGLDFPADRVRQAVEGSGLEFRLAVSLIRALDRPPDLFLRSPLELGSDEPGAGDESGRDVILANLARLGAALPPAPPLSPAEAGGILARCATIAARRSARPAEAPD